jgi:hypothetical protein
MAIVTCAAFMRQRSPWAVALLVLVVAATSPLTSPPASPVTASIAIDGVTASLQLPGEELPEKLPVAIISLSEAGLEESRVPGQRPGTAGADDSRTLPPRFEHVFHAAATETVVRYAQLRIQAYPLDPHLRLLNPGNAPPLV